MIIKFYFLTISANTNKINALNNEIMLNRIHSNHERTKSRLFKNKTRA